MEQEQLSSVTLQQWANSLRSRGLVGIALPLLDLLQVWGYVGGQILWMLAPFFGERNLAPFATALERPEHLRRLQQHLLEGDAPR